MADMLRTIIERCLKDNNYIESFLSFAQLKEYRSFPLDKVLVEEYHHQSKEEGSVTAVCIIVHIEQLLSASESRD